MYRHTRNMAWRQRLQAVLQSFVAINAFWAHRRRPQPGWRRINRTGTVHCWNISGLRVKAGEFTILECYGTRSFEWTRTLKMWWLHHWGRSAQCLELHELLKFWHLCLCFFFNCFVCSGLEFSSTAWNSLNPSKCKHIEGVQSCFFHSWPILWK